MKKRKAIAILVALAMVFTMMPVTAFGESPDNVKGATWDDPFTNVQDYNEAVEGSDWDGKDIYLRIEGDFENNEEINEGDFQLANVQDRPDPPKLHLILQNLSFEGNTSGDNTNTSFMYLSNCQELFINNCSFDAGEGDGLKYGINWNLINIVGADVWIQNCSFEGNYKKNAIKLNQRNGADDAAGDVKTGGEEFPSTINYATIKNCTFNGNNAIISMGSQGKGPDGAASPSTGAFDIDIYNCTTNNEQKIIIRKDYDLDGNAGEQEGRYDVETLIDDFATVNGAERVVEYGGIGWSQYYYLEDALKVIKHFSKEYEGVNHIGVLKNHEYSNTLKIDWEDTIFLDLNGKTIQYTGEGDYAIELSGKTYLDIMDDTEKGAINSPKRVIRVGDALINGTGTPATLYVEGVTLNAAFDGEDSGQNDAAVAIYANNSRNHGDENEVDCLADISDGATLNGGVYVFGQGAELNVREGAKISAHDAFAISGNGSNNDSQNCGGTHIWISGGEITQTGDGVAIYHPQDGNIYIEGGKITGNTGIEMRAGSLTVIGGTIEGTGTETTSESNKNGNTTSGAGIAVAQHTTKLPINVCIEGGKISGHTSVYQSNPEENGAEEIEYIWIGIEGGELEAINGGEDALNSKDARAYIDAGTFKGEIINGNEVTANVIEIGETVIIGDEDYINEAIENADIAEGAKVNVKQVSEEDKNLHLELPDGTTAINSSDKRIFVNDVAVQAGEEITIEDPPTYEPPETPSEVTDAMMDAMQIPDVSDIGFDAADKASIDEAREAYEKAIAENPAYEVILEPTLEKIEAAEAAYVAAKQKAFEATELDIELTQDEFYYNKKAKTPDVVAGLEDFTEGVDYEITYVDNTKAGIGSVVIEGKGNLEGFSVSKDILIRPYKGVINKVVTKRNSITVTSRDQSAGGITGYQFAWRVTNSGDDWKTKMIKSKNYKTTIKKLKANTRYSVKVRGIVKVDGTRYYGEWSKLKKITVKR